MSPEPFNCLRKLLSTAIRSSLFHLQPAVSSAFPSCAAEQKCDCNCGSAEQCVTEPSKLRRVLSLL